MLLKRVRTCYRYWYIDLAAKKYLIALKAEVDKLDINKMTNVPTSLGNLKTKVGDLGVGKLKIVPTDLEKIEEFGTSWSC